jgi:hypothetical protein
VLVASVAEAGLGLLGALLASLSCDEPDWSSFLLPACAGQMPPILMSACLVPHLPWWKIVLPLESTSRVAVFFIAEPFCALPPPLFGVASWVATAAVARGALWTTGAARAGKSEGNVVGSGGFAVAKQ